MTNMASPHPDEREVYRFTATDTEGNRREGTVLATDPGDVAHQLPTGWTLRECRLLELVEPPLPAWAGGDAPPAATTPALTLTDFLTESDAGEMATHLAALAQSGIPLEGGLRALAE
ncbi:MAG: hypothetical protein ACKOJF_24105, partial [Planctomycetaceae bacterium]